MITWFKQEDLYGCYFEHSIVVLDYRTGTVRALHGPGITKQIESEIMSALHPGASPGRRRLRLSPGQATGLSFGAEEHEAGLTTSPSDVNASRTAKVAAVLALSVVLAAKVLGRRGKAMHRLILLAHWAASLPTKSATTEEADHHVRLIRQLASEFPARVACLEESIAATVALALRGRSVTWCHEVAVDPFTFHAWVQTDSPVAEPASTNRYTTLRIIPEPPTR